ncbi:hypothetical protein RRG08_049461 [Elysia crispata]|uniref:Uncharacterized protein n=1 Tax=Elysia crispata TaxID=231223 RepID=A0AAE1DLS8_9GAST|nr:hypothetical protein RRG08_049461 [Elysia crispata]
MESFSDLKSDQLIQPLMKVVGVITRHSISSFQNQPGVLIWRERDLILHATGGHRPVIWLTADWPVTLTNQTRTTASIIQACYAKRLVWWSLWCQGWVSPWWRNHVSPASLDMGRLWRDLIRREGVMLQLPGQTARLDSPSLNSPGSGHHKRGSQMQQVSQRWRYSLTIGCQIAARYSTSGATVNSSGSVYTPDASRQVEKCLRTP